ncbi:redoxin domain-containing protein [Candidatus Micrarchaeota archaeon]|nr:redoxin domain-containing protein [Candidatus Micrarchaeota archaeon]
MNKFFVFLFLFALLISGCTSAKTNTKTEVISPEITPSEKPIEKEIVSPELTVEVAEEKKSNASLVQKENESSQPINLGYSPFEKSKYGEAKSSGKIIFLEFYANWCPICAIQEPEIEDAFKEINNPNLIGFRVNYNDGETDADEISLAKEFGITYQHTHVILDENGNVVVKSLESWSKDKIKEEIEKVD